MLNLKTIPADWPNEPLAFGEPEALTRADIAILREVDKGFVGQPMTALKRLTERHHALARLLATGTTPGHAAVITGYDSSRISILQTDPSFKELVEFYSNEVNAEYRTMQAQMAGLGEDAVAELRRRVEEDPESLGAGFLLDIVTKIADRTGNGPTSTTKSEVNVTIDLATRMKQARERAQQAIEGVSVRDITPQAAE